MSKVTPVYNAHGRRKATPRTQSLTTTHGKKGSRLSGTVFLEEEGLPIQELGDNGGRDATPSTSEPSSLNKTKMNKDTTNPLLLS